MNRYSMLWGTSPSGEYRLLWSSRGMADFLGSLGATDRGKTADTTQNILRAFGDFPDYPAQPSDDKPVAIHYAPMHLYKLPEFPAELKPFCALSVTGAENRPGGRNSTYSQTFLFPCELMRGKEKGVNALDLLFGTHLLSWQEVKAFRDKTRTPNFDAAPRKVQPEFTDLQTALYAASVLLESRGEKNLILRLEKDRSFNRRALALLAQIYSLLPPRLAVETGFATYHPVEDIAEISRKNSICVFVLPASADIRPLEGGKNILLDLSDEAYRAPLRQTPLTEVLLSWSKLSWEKRCEAYQSLFADAENYQDSNAFLQRSQAFFASLQDCQNWISSHGEGTLRSLEDLRRLLADEPSWQQIPWYKELLRAALPGLLPKNVQFSSWLDAAAAQYKLAEDSETKKKAGELYQFGAQFGETDVPGLCDSVSGILKERHATELAQQRTRLTTEFTAKLDALGQQLRQEQENAAQLKEAARKKILEQQERAQTAEHQLSETSRQLDEQKQKAAADVENMKRKHEQELAERLDQQLAQQRARAKAECQEKLREQDSVISRQKAELETERRRRQTAEEALMRAEEAASGDHEQRRSRVKDDRPRFIRKQPWWLPVLIAALLGAGICWLMASLIGWLGNDNGTIMNEQTAQTGQAPEEQVPQEEPQHVEETPEEPEEQPVEEPEETPVSEDTPGSQNGNDETATQEMIQKVSGMAWTFTGENIQRDYCPEPLNGFGVVLMAFSNQPKAPAALTETAEPMPENGADNTAEDQTENAGAAGTEPAENGDAAAADAQTPVADTQTPSEEQEKYAILFRENDTVDQDELIEKLRQIPDASLILRHNGLTMIVYGDAEMQMLALTAMDAIYPAGETAEDAASQTEDTQEVNAETAETAEKDVLLLRVEDVLLDITEAFQTADSWRVVQKFRTDGIPMAFAAQAQALTVEPALTIVCDMECVFIYDFREAQEEAETLMARAKNTDLHVLDVDGFVLVSEKN